VSKCILSENFQLKQKDGTKETFNRTHHFFRNKKYSSTQIILVLVKANYDNLGMLLVRLIVLEPIGRNWDEGKGILY
jgi:hypothetical protein